MLALMILLVLHIAISAGAATAAALAHVAFRRATANLLAAAALRGLFLTSMEVAALLARVAALLRLLEIASAHTLPFALAAGPFVPIRHFILLSKRMTNVRRRAPFRQRDGA